MGRKTYEQCIKLAGTSYQEKQSYVFWNTPHIGRTNVVTGINAEFVRQLKAQMVCLVSRWR